MVVVSSVVLVMQASSESEGSVLVGLEPSASPVSPGSGPSSAVSVHTAPIATGQFLVTAPPIGTVTVLLAQCTATRTEFEDTLRTPQPMASIRQSHGALCMFELEFRVFHRRIAIDAASVLSGSHLRHSR